MTTGTSQQPLVQRKKLTKDQVNQFWLDGFLVIGKIFSENEIKYLREAYDREFHPAHSDQITIKPDRPSFRNLSSNSDDLEKKNNAGSQMLQIMNMCERSLEYRELLYDVRLLDIVEDLIGPNIQLFHDQALFKPAHLGGPIHWHQDNSYWKCTPPNLVSCWITLDQVDIHNGAMQFMPGSHRQSMGHNQASEGSLLEASNPIDESKSIVVTLPAGGMTLHHCQTLHRTAPNTTDRKRRAHAIHYMIPGTRKLDDQSNLEVSFSRPMLRMRI